MATTARFNKRAFCRNHGNHVLQSPQVKLVGEVRTMCLTPAQHLRQQMYTPSRSTCQ